MTDREQKSLIRPSKECPSAHSSVLLKPIEHPDGTRSDHWECADCGTEFWPNVPGKRPRPGNCTCPANGVSHDCPTHGAVPQSDATAALRKYIHEQLGFLTDDDNRPAEGLVRLAAKRLGVTPETLQSIKAGCPHTELGRADGRGGWYCMEPDCGFTIWPKESRPAPETDEYLIARPAAEWHEDLHDVLWWRFPIEEPPYCGSPLDTHWQEHELEKVFTHWSPIPIPHELKANDPLAQLEDDATFGEIVEEIQAQRGEKSEDV